MVRRASKNRIGRFSKQDIRELCPTLSDSSIEGALRKLVAARELKKEGRGKNTCYFRLNYISFNNKILEDRICSYEQVRSF